LAQEWKVISRINGVPIEQVSKEDIKKLKLKMARKFQEVFGLQLIKDK